MPTPPDSPSPNLSPYAGRWVAIVRGAVVGQGGTPEQALTAAKAARHKETPEIRFVPMNTSWNLPPLLERIRAALPARQPVYLVGGAVRDLLLQRPLHDFDFVLPGDTLKISRRLADRLGAAYYPLDAARETARVILMDEDGQHDVLDFAALRAPNLESDLRDRDFTINAMAMDLRAPGKLLDPLGGAADLRSKRLRACSPASMQNDPVRVLRAVRMAAAFNLHIDPETRQQMRAAVPGLMKISPERRRDEILKILNGPSPHTALRALDMLQALPAIFPELSSLKGVEQSPPHIHDVWEHTLNTLRALESVLDILTHRPDPEASGNLLLGELSLRLGRYREQIRAHLEAEMIPDRPVRALLFLAALYHDIAKPKTRSVDNGSRVRFFEHDRQGAEIVRQRAGQLRLSNDEKIRVQRIVRYHMRPLLLANEPRPPSKRAIYRFFRDAGEAGVDICLLALADTAATYGHTLSPETWRRQIEIVQQLLKAWWEQPQKEISPPALITGKDLLALGLQPSPLIGELLEAVRVAQIEGDVQTREDALAFVKQHLIA